MTIEQLFKFVEDNDIPFNANLVTTIKVADSVQGYITTANYDQVHNEVVITGHPNIDKAKDSIGE